MANVLHRLLLLNLQKVLGLCFVLFAFGIGARVSRAQSFVQQWDASANAKKYEFELYQSSKLTPESLVRQGSVSEPKLSLTISPGFYFLRVRAIDTSNRPGTWSNVIRVFVNTSAPDLKTPAQNEIVEVPSSSTAIAFEWSSVEGATEYELRVVPSDKAGARSPITQIVQGPQALVRGLSAGAYRYRVIVRQDGAALAATDWRSFQIGFRSSARPRFLQPQDGDLLTSFETHRIRWQRSVSGSKSTVVITRIEGSLRPVVSRETVHNKTWSQTPPLAPGRYQISVRDHLGSSDETVDQTVSITVQNDPFGYHSQYLGLTWRLLSMAGNFGDSSQNGYWSNDSLIRLNTRKTIQTRLAGILVNNWGFEAQFDATEHHTIDAPNRDGDAIWNKRVALGLSHRLQFQGPHQFMWLRAGYVGHGLNLLEEQNNFGLRAQAAGLHGIYVGADYRLGGWNPRYDFYSEASLDLPLLAEGGGRSGGPSLSLSLPSIIARAHLRRKIGDEWRVLVGVHFQAQRLRFSQGGRTQNIGNYNVGPSLGLEWDL